MDRQGGFHEHDDRFGGPVRRGGRGGRGGRGRGGRGNRGREVNPRTRFDDDNSESLQSDNFSRGRKNRYQPYGARSDKNRPQSDDAGGSVFTRLGGQTPSGGSVFHRLSGNGGVKSGGDTWHKVTIQKGGLENKEWLLKKLASSITEAFEPIGTHVLGDKLMFFIAESRAANQFKELTSIESRNGELSIFVKPSPPPRESKGSANSRGGREVKATFGTAHGGRRRPNDTDDISFGTSYGGRRRPNDADDISMQEDASEVIQRVLGQRYNPQIKLLDLSNMYNDPVFRESGTRASMFDRNIVSTILTLIGKYCPDLLSLDLSNNRLQRLELYADLSAKCSELQILNLSANQIRSPLELEHMAGLKKLTTLVLENNPLSQHNADFASYSSSLRKTFPSLQLLDGQQLSSPVKFDLPVSLGQLPSVEKSYLVNDDVKTLVATFLEQYYMIYDSDSREKLLEAYSNDAIFSFSACPGGPRAPGMQEYLIQSRNLLKVKDQGKRKSLSKRGRIDIVQFLRDLPHSRHFSKTFTVDVVSATPVGTAFVVNGIFSEVGGRMSGNNPVYAFSRMFVVSAVGNGVAVSNDQFTIRGPTHQGLQYVQDELSKLEGTQLPTSVQPTNSPSTSYSSAQIEAVHRLSKETQMNLEWSKRCLEENGWDFNKSMTVFTVLQSEGKVPKEAFL